MKITLVKKSDQSDKQPLLCQWETEENGTMVKKTIKVAIGESLDIPDDEAYTLLAKYKGMFAPASHVATQGKSMKQYSDKTAAAG